VTDMRPFFVCNTKYLLIQAAALPRADVVATCALTNEFGEIQFIKFEKSSACCSIYYPLVKSISAVLTVCSEHASVGVCLQEEMCAQDDGSLDTAACQFDRTVGVLQGQPDVAVHNSHSQ